MSRSRTSTPSSLNNPTPPENSPVSSRTSMNSQGSSSDGRRHTQKTRSIGSVTPGGPSLDDLARNKRVVSAGSSSTLLKPTRSSINRSATPITADPSPAHSPTPRHRSSSEYVSPVPGVYTPHRPGPSSLSFGTARRQSPASTASLNDLLPQPVTT